jgi:hypothetical protein
MMIKQVHPDLVPKLMPEVSKYIAMGLEHTDSCTLEHAQVHLASGNWMLLVAMEDEKIVGAYVLSFYNEPTERIALIVSAAGSGLASQGAANQVFDHARSRGATKMQVLARESAARLYKRVGLTEKATLMEIKL